MHSPREYFNNIGSICTDSLRHGNGLSALVLLTRAAKSSAAKINAAKTRSLESRLKVVFRVSGGHLETNNSVMRLSERTRILSARPTSDCLCTSIDVKGLRPLPFLVLIVRLLDG